MRLPRWMVCWARTESPGPAVPGTCRWCGVAGSPWAYFRIFPLVWVTLSGIQPNISISQLSQWAQKGLWGAFWKEAVCVKCLAWCLACCRQREGSWQVAATSVSSGHRFKAGWEAQFWHTWHALPCSPFSQMYVLGLLAWSPGRCYWWLQPAQGCLERSQLEVGVMQLTWLLEMARAWLFERKWVWAWKTHSPFLRPETALTLLFCSHYLLWCTGKGVAKQRACFILPLHHSWKVRPHQDTSESSCILLEIWSTSQYLLNTYWIRQYSESPKNLHVCEKNKDNIT